MPVLYKYWLGEPRLHRADESKKVVKARSSSRHGAAAAPSPSPPVSARKHGLGIWVPPLLCEWASCSLHPRLSSTFSVAWTLFSGSLLALQMRTSVSVDRMEAGKSVTSSKMGAPTGELDSALVLPQPSAEPSQVAGGTVLRRGSGNKVIQSFSSSVLLFRIRWWIVCLREERPRLNILVLES